MRLVLFADDNDFILETTLDADNLHDLGEQIKDVANDIQGGQYNKELREHVAEGLDDNGS